MTEIYNKTKTPPYDLSLLQAEINEDTNIVPSCLSITGTGDQLIVTMAATLSDPDEVNALDAVIAAHVAPTENISVSRLPFSPLDGKKLAVHQSTKPQIDGITTYAVWGGAGDNGVIGDGELLDFELTPGKASETKTVEYSGTHGRVWVHEGYLKFEGGGHGDYISADILAKATALQTSVNLDLEITDNWVHLAAGGPGTGTHGFAGTPVLIPRPFSKDGDWDYDGTTLSPNVAGTGEYKISDIIRTVHRYFNKIPCCGTCSAFFSMTSNETTEMPAGYYMEITAFNNSNTTWMASVIMEIYRQRTHVP